MHKRSLGGRLSANPVRISSNERDERRRTQTLKSRAASTSEETHIPRPRFRSSSVDATTAGRKSSLKPSVRIQQSQHGMRTPQASTAKSVTPRSSQSGNKVKSTCPPGSGVRGRSPSAERASNVATKVTRKDNRPLGEKSFQSEMLNKIDSFLISNNQSDLLNSNGSIKPITLQMLVEVSDLLAKRLDVKQSLTMINYIEELPKIAKKLHYPGQMNKSWLKTPNAMFSWPQVLGWLSWLVEACIARDLALEHFQLETLPFLELDNTPRELHEVRLQFLLDAYRAWNEEKAEEEVALTEAYLKKIADLQGVSEADIEKAERQYENETVMLRDAQIKSQELDNEIEQLEDELAFLKREKVGRDDLIKYLEDAEKSHLEETEAIKEETKILQDTIQQQKIREQELKAQIESQPMSARERDEIIERCGAMQEQMKELDTHLNDLEKELFMLDVKLTSIRSNVNKLVFAYNKEIYLDLGSASKEAGIDVEDIAMPITGIGEPDLMDELERRAKIMATFRENMERKNKSIESVVMAEKNKLELLEGEKLALELKREGQMMEDYEDEERIESIKIAARAEQTKLKESIENLKHEIKDLKDQMPDIEQEGKEIAEAREKIEALTRRKDYLQESARLFFVKMSEIFAQQNNKLARLFERKNDSEL